MMFFQQENEKKIFLFGQNAEAEAEQAAQNCAAFRLDYEEELATTTERSCYNCRYRRWTADSFQCMKK